MKTKEYYLFRFSLLLLFLQSIYCWFLIDYFKILIALTFILGILFFLSSPKILDRRKSNVVPGIIILIIQLYVVIDSTFYDSIAALLRSFILIFVLLLADKIKIDLIKFFVKAFAIVLSVSLIAWVAFLIGVKLPSSPFNFGETYHFDNYYLFLFWDQNQFQFFPRFSSVFLEPGQLGMITVFLLCSIKCDTKRKEFWVFIIAILLSFSLASYLLTIVAIFGFFVVKTKRVFLYISLFLVAIASIYLFFSTYNNGNNVVNVLIFERLYIEDGDLSGNNRFSEDMDSYFQKFLGGEDAFTGNSSEKYQKLDLGANAGYKVVIVRHGLIGFFLILSFYISVFIYNKSKFSLIFLFVYLFCFLQNAYPLWESVLLIFITSMAHFKYDQLDQRKNVMLYNYI